jgi:hypothetical protein
MWVLKICFHVGNRILIWILTVFALGALPIALHLWTVKINRAGDQMFAAALISDAYLYTFIVAMTAFIDTLVDDRLRPSKMLVTFSYCGIAILAALGYFAASIKYVLDGPGGRVLQVCVWPLLIIFVASYAIYKLPILYGAGRADLEQEVQSAVRKGQA